MYTVTMFIPGDGLYVDGQGPFDPEEYYRENYINDYLVPALKKVLPGNKPPTNEYMTIPEVSAWLGYSEQTIRNKMSPAKGEFVQGIHYVKLGEGKKAKIGFIRSALEQMIANQNQQPKEETTTTEAQIATLPSGSTDTRSAAPNKDHVNI